MKKTTREYWEAVHSTKARLRLPSGLLVSTQNLRRLLKAHIRPQMHVLEIGCAPGKQLAWVAKVLKAKVSGVDFSRWGIEFSRQLFKALDIEGDLRCEDILSSSFDAESFDVVYSTGVIEHFEKPEIIVRQHVKWLKKNGVALLAIPNYGGTYGKFQRYFDPENLLIHNLKIMSCDGLARLAPVDLTTEIEVFRAGRVDPWLINFHKKWPEPLAKALSYIFNGLGVVQPFDVAPLCPWLVLRLVRA